MKKMLVAMIVVVFVFAAVPAMATTAKVPKSICMAVDATIISFTMTTSKGGTAVVSGGEKITTYDIQGSMNMLYRLDNNFPLHGSGICKEYF